VCGREDGHPGACYYDRPDRAGDRWAPARGSTPELMQHYQRRCRELGVPARQPGERGPRPAPAALAAAALLEDPAVMAAAAELLADQQQDDFDEQETSSLVDWQLAGSCVPEESYIAAAAETRAARSSQQPLSFVPPVNVQPRARITRSSSNTSPAPEQAAANDAPPDTCAGGAAN
jgi:hypothetical protein